MDHFQRIYAERGPDYERLIVREDYQDHLWRVLWNLTDWRDKVVIEFGAGTGRLTRRIPDFSSMLIATDFSHHMLSVAQNLKMIAGNPLVHLSVGDNRTMPIASDVADIAIEGWSFGHVTGWYPETWQSELDRSLNEMKRVLKPGGIAILLETLGTGFEEPQPPTPQLETMYHLFENDYGFSREIIRTDYQFESLEEAIELTTFFFGDELAQQARENNWVILPECTGLWWRTF